VCFADDSLGSNAIDCETSQMPALNEALTRAAGVDSAIVPAIDCVRSAQTNVPNILPVTRPNGQRPVRCGARFAICKLQILLGKGRPMLSLATILIFAVTILFTTTYQQRFALKRMGPLYTSYCLYHSKRLSRHLKNRTDVHDRYKTIANPKISVRQLVRMTALMLVDSARIMDETRFGAVVACCRTACGSGALCGSFALPSKDRIHSSLSRC
jgi:hypothetical protein